MSGGRSAALAAAAEFLHSGEYQARLAARVAIPTESQNPARAADCDAYLRDLAAELDELGFGSGLHPNPASPGHPFLVARRVEDPGLRTILIYGHGDVVLGMEGQWAKDRCPWTLHVEGDRLYGRGTCDNKGQHILCLLALRAVLETRGRLGFNCTVLIETGEEVGSPGLHDFCRAHAGVLQADVLVASDGPRLRPSRPTILLGTRGILNFTLEVDLRARGYHSGNHGGLLRSASIYLCNALASIADGNGAIKVPGWRPACVPPAVAQAIADLPTDSTAHADHDWGEPGLTPAERLMAWNSFEILSMEAGDPARPVNAIPPRARAHCSLRYIMETSPEVILPSLRTYLDDAGFELVRIIPWPETGYRATRMDLGGPDVRTAVASIRSTCGATPDIIPNAGGTLPNEAFAHLLGATTIWVPHSYSECSQHAPDEHLLLPLVDEGLRLMAGLYWDFGESAAGA